jgi:hypothetical protein
MRKPLCPLRPPWRPQRSHLLWSKHLPSCQQLPQLFCRIQLLYPSFPTLRPLRPLRPAAAHPAGLSASPSWALQWRVLVHRQPLPLGRSPLPSWVLREKRFRVARLLRPSQRRIRRRRGHLLLL